MSRAQAMAAAVAALDSGRFETDLARLVAVPTDSTRPEHRPDLWRYLRNALAPRYRALGCTVEILPAADTPVLIARRIEDPALPTVLTYGHGDVVPGMAGRWTEGAPFTLRREGERLYGRGTADNKGQHLINLLALEAVLATRGRLGFNLVVLIETAEEIGSPELKAFCAEHRGLLQADLLLASDGPRVAPDLPTLELGARGVLTFTLSVDLRREAHHSGNWGGIIADPGVLLAHAIAAVSSATGVLHVPEWRPKALAPTLRKGLARVPFDAGDGGDKPEPGWGEPGLALWEKLTLWTSFAVLAMDLGTPEQPVNAIQPRATAHCGLRFTDDVDQADLLPALRRFLEARGLGMVRVTPGEAAFPATRHDPTEPLAAWAAASMELSLGRAPVVLPCAPGGLPNDIFARDLGMVTLWVPHSYNSCGQHAPDEHLLLPIAREGLALMAGLWWDMAEIPLPPRAAQR